MRGFTFTSVIVLVIVVAVVGVAAVLLARTVQEAQSINAKAQNIATNGRGINESTDAVVQLNRTNDLAGSILDSARPLDTQLGRIVATAKGIDSLASSINAKAGSINSTAVSINDTAGAINTSAGEINSAAESINSSAGAINSTAGEINQSAGSIDTSAGAINVSAGEINTSAGDINATARGIEDEATSILRTARLVDNDVRLINQNLDVSLALVTAVKADTGDILDQARAAHQTATCIDQKLYGQAAPDGHCQGQPQGDAPTQPVSREDTRMSRKAFEGLVKKAPKPPEAAAPDETEKKVAEKPRERQKVTIPLTERLPETPTTKQLDKIVECLVPSLLGRDGTGLLGGNKDCDKRLRDEGSGGALGRLLPVLPELPSLGR